MPSYVHELLLLLFRNRTNAAAEILRKLDVHLPEYDDVRIEASDLNQVEPAEYRADLVMFLMRGAQKELGIIVEVQLQRKEEKRYAWPAYVANLRARHRCPVCLLVVTTRHSVARWAAGSISLGPGNHFTPLVIGPANTPLITEPDVAEENVELAVLSAIEHGRNANAAVAASVASAAIRASESVDTERSKLYLDLILLSLSESARQALGSMNSLGFEYQSDFARKYVTQGRAEMVLKLLAQRFGPLKPDSRANIEGASYAKLGEIADRLLTAPTLADALKPLRRAAGRGRAR